MEEKNQTILLHPNTQQKQEVIIMAKYKFTEDLIYSQNFSFEVLSYFDSITTDENFEWIKKYFNVLMNDDNIKTEKFNMHHIRPCCTFKDKEHRNRIETKPLADAFNGNRIKLSIYNHFYAHYYLWKIFNNWDLKCAFQRMYGQEQYKDDLSENELDEIAKLKENCTEKNQTKEERKLKDKEYKIVHKENISNYQKEYYILNKTKILNDKKEYRELNKEKISKNRSRLCYDPKKEDYCKLSTLNSRKHRNKELYKDVIPSKCIIK